MGSEGLEIATRSLRGRNPGPRRPDRAVRVGAGAGWSSAPSGSGRGEQVRHRLCAAASPVDGLVPPSSSCGDSISQWDGMLSSGCCFRQSRFPRGPMFVAQGYRLTGSGNPVRPRMGRTKDEDDLPFPVVWKVDGHQQTWFGGWIAWRGWSRHVFRRCR